MGTPHIRRATEEDSGALATLVPGLAPSGTDEHHATFVIDGPEGRPVAVLDLLQGERHLDLLHLRAPDLAYAQLLQGFAEEAAQVLRAPEIRLAPGAMDDAQATALGYSGGIMQVRPGGVPLWRDGTASLAQSLYYRGVWASLALLTGLGSVSLAVFSGGQLTLVHIFLPAILCVVGTLFALWQILLIVQASRRSRPWVFALSAAVALATVGLVGITLNDRAVPALSELWAIRAGDSDLGELDIGVADNGRVLVVSGAYGTHGEEVVRKALAANKGVRTVILSGPGGRASVGFALFQMFRERKLATHVSGTCASACTIAFLGGVERTVSPSGRLGFHAASFPGMGEGDMQDANRGIRNFMVYSARLTPEFARRVIETPAESIWVPTREELLTGKVITR